MPLLGHALLVALALSGLGAPLPDAELALQRGTGSPDETIYDLIQMSTIDQRAVLTDNIVYSSVNGANAVTHGAFAGASGISTVIQNSGNQVLIQNALIVNLTLE